MTRIESSLKAVYATWSEARSKRKALFLVLLFLLVRPNLCESLLPNHVYEGHIEKHIVDLSNGDQIWAALLFMNALLDMPTIVEGKKRHVE